MANINNLLIMIIYLAGGVTGNLNPVWRKISRSPEIFMNGFRRVLEDEGFLAGGESRHWILYDAVPLTKENEDMELYLAGNPPWINQGLYDKTIAKHRPYILESFYYADKDTERLLPYFGDFLLDSGAFTFMMGNHKKEIDWDAYLEKYTDFINRNNIDKFFELDIDSIVGYQKVLYYRERLEKLTNKQPIIVWHKTRGSEIWKKECEEYPYVAIGGFAAKELSKNEYKYIPSMISYAHKNNTKVHGLGFTQTSLLPKFHFDSVDSTAWTTGNRFGYIYKFRDGKMEKIFTPEGKRLESRKAALNNFIEWNKYSEWAKTHL